jgi:hypothetical protein
VRPRATWVAWGLIAFGAAVRVRLFVAGRSFWYDEAALALNLVNRSAVELLRPLDYRQTAPPLFLWLERLAVLVAGPTEYALRAVPLLAGVATLVVSWRVARRLLPGDAALVALALVALSPLLVYYSNELKPYSLDALVSAGLVAMALTVLDRPDDRRAWRWLALGGAAAPLFSTTAPFAMAGVAACLLLEPRVRATPEVMRRAAVTSAAWVAAGLVALFVHQDLVGRDSPTGAYMQGFWQHAFLTTDPPGLRMRAWAAAFGALKVTFIDGVSRQRELSILVLAAALGLGRLAHRNRLAIGALVAVPFACLGLAAALRLYPFDSRLILFAAPLTALMLGAGVTWPGSVIAARMSRPAGVAVTAALACVLLVIPARRAVRAASVPPGRHEVRPLIRAIDRARDADPNAGPVWMTAGVELPWRFYAGDSLSGVEATARVPVAGTTTPLAPGVLVGDWWHGGDRGLIEAERLRAAANGSCGWFIFAMDNDEERSAVLSAVERLRGRLAETTERAGAASYRVCFQTSD